ncbi:serine hydrolase domain-containing protein [Nonomuraea jiangxiensis]|uniref:CubicO group peptidase, beta-lactamase class C family n=1 Tax=Nonomuraea jiangxiensis TaxID=633440 RepID=A0A1G9F538_9ACTN|nr:serine hydrolase domain-containing protein [Nonomuraea jiangxiensis]SDK83461.1 CubicO group peptidase, beta-lactamase class C family [Nonomuraea jiangxiensis]
MARPLPVLLIAAALAVTTALPAAAAVDGPPTVTIGDVRFADKVLRYGSARAADLVPEHVSRIAPDAAVFMRPSPARPLYPGAVVIAGRDGVIAAHEAMGQAVRYADSKPTELPPDQQHPMRRDTIFDLASVSKLFTSIVAVQQIEHGRIGLDTPVTAYVPEFAANGKGGITVRHLLTHTSGLPSWIPLHTAPTLEARYAAVWNVVPSSPPETVYVYSDLNLITLGVIVERVTGRRLDAVVAEGLTGPLGMRDTGYNPDPALKPRIAATEYQTTTEPDRGLVWGQVHDENAWSLGGVAGHAGVFSTAYDLAVLAQTLLNGGHYGRTRVLSQDSVRLLLTNFNTAFPSNSHGLGFELDQMWFMDGLSSPVTGGHTGYTGTSLVIDPLSGSFMILLTNRVHPSRDWGSNNPARRAVARDLALAVPVRPAQGPDAWFSGVGDARTATLTLPVGAPQGGRLSFALWYDTEADSDVGFLEASTDGGATWSPVPMELSAGRHRWSSDGTFSGFQGRRWLRAQAQLATGTTGLRWRYASDTLYQGRGVYVDEVRISGPGVRFEDRNPRDAALFVPDGWTRSRN